MSSIQIIATIDVLPDSIQSIIYSFCSMNPHRNLLGKGYHFTGEVQSQNIDGHSTPGTRKSGFLTRALLLSQQDDSLPKDSCYQG